jgi:acyl-coenzyme A thioesterase PaaI-like protein
MSEVRLEVNNRCFGCGADNARGLRMQIERRGDEWVSRLTVPEHFQGWAEIAHGGFLCTVMDEVMGWAARGGAGDALTARLDARFLQPVAVGREIAVRGRMTQRRGRVVRARAQIELEDGTVAAKATGVFVIMADGGD